MNTLVAALQLLVAAAFLSIPLVRHRYGTTAMAGAQTEPARQGVRTSVLAENGMRFDASGHETAAAAGVAAVMVTMAALNLLDSSWVSTSTWIFQSLVLLGDCVILYSRLTATRSVRAAFARKGDPELAGVDVPALHKAAEDGFPTWTRTLQNVRDTVVFGASVLALALPAAV
ncbi:hypothetical protein ACFV0T_12650 [Streptomyces sp. NPDC059582]|uniref:hypothetical protein n=1 Tax=Streptomyces sp. NPDC059582 TaxID=3346875 RepID=UPI0036761CC8